MTALIVSGAAVAFGVSAAGDSVGQDRPLQVLFSAGATSEFRIQLSVTARLDGEQTQTIGAKTYVAPFTREAKSILSWRAQVRVISVAADGAEIEESLSEFSATPAEIAAADSAPARMAQALNDALAGWSVERTIRYRETQSGAVSGIPAEGAPALDEQAPRVLSAWLLRALRPAVVLPARPVLINDHWQEVRSVTLPNWSGASGSESGQWLATSGSKFQVRLDDVQQLSATVISGPEKPPEGAAAADFRGESLGTVALDDGRLVSATRSAARTIVWTLTPAAGLPAAPRFSERLAVETQIENCDESTCDDLHSELRGSR